MRSDSGGSEEEEAIAVGLAIGIGVAFLNGFGAGLGGAFSTGSGARLGALNCGTIVEEFVGIAWDNCVLQSDPGGFEDGKGTDKNDVEDVVEGRFMNICSAR